MPNGEVFIGDLPLLNPAQQTILSTDVVVGVVNGVAYTIHMGDVPPNTEVAADITAIETAISALETQCSKGNTGIKNIDLYNMLANTVLPAMGYTATATTDANQNITAVTITKNTAANSNSLPDAFTQFSDLANTMVGSRPAYNSTSHNHELNISLDTAMNSDFTVKLKGTNFDHQWVAGRTYTAGAVIVKDGTILQCNYTNNDSTFNAAHWDTISAGGSGGGINPATPGQNYIDLFTTITNGLRKALDPAYIWALDGNLWYENLSTADKALVKNYMTTYAEDSAYQGQAEKPAFGFIEYDDGHINKIFSNQDQLPLWAWPSDAPSVQMNEEVLNNPEYFSDENILQNDSLKIRGSILEMLTRATSSYENYINYINGHDTTEIWGYPDDTETEPSTSSRNSKMTNQTLLNSDNPDPELSDYMMFTVNKHECSDYDDHSTFRYNYNPYADLIHKILQMSQPVVVTGVFEASNWSLSRYSSSGDPYHEEDLGTPIAYACPLTQISCPSGVGTFNKDLLTKANVIMDVRLPAPILDSNGDVTSNNTARKAVLAAYNQIMDTNLSNWSSNNAYYLYNEYPSDPEHEGYGLKAFVEDPNHTGGIASRFDYPDTGTNSWNYVQAFIDIEDTPPSVDIPVSFLVYPHLYNYGTMFHQQGDT